MDKMAQVAVKEGVRGAETRAAGHGAAMEDEVRETQKCRGEEPCCAYACARTHAHVKLAPCLHSVNLIHSLK